MCQRPPASSTLPVQVAWSSKAPGGPGLSAVGSTSQSRRSRDTAWPIWAWLWRRSGWPRLRGACRKKTCTSSPSVANQKSQIQCPGSRRLSASSGSPPPAEEAWLPWRSSSLRRRYLPGQPGRRVGEQAVDLVLVGLEDPDLHDLVAAQPVQVGAADLHGVAGRAEPFPHHQGDERPGTCTTTSSAKKPKPVSQSPRCTAWR